MRGEQAELHQTSVWSKIQGSILVGRGTSKVKIPSASSNVKPHSLGSHERYHITEKVKLWDKFNEWVREAKSRMLPPIRIDPDSFLITLKKSFTGRCT